MIPQKSKNFHCKNTAFAVFLFFVNIHNDAPVLLESHTAESIANAQNTPSTPSASISAFALDRTHHTII